MALYKYNTSGVFSEIKEKPFKLERDIQRMFETNMSEIMGLEMIKSEFTIKDRRIDTLAFDPQSKDTVSRLCKIAPQPSPNPTTGCGGNCSY